MFKEKPLKGQYKDYEPYISAEIMELHYSKHYCGYLKNLNEALKECPNFFNLEIHRILSRLSDIPENIRRKVRNNGGGIINHEILWETLDTKSTEIHQGPFKEAIEKTFGNWDKFKENMIAEGTNFFGSGWTWLVMDSNKNLKLMSTANQDSPYMEGYYPVFGIDLWEHSYYLQHKNLKTNYLQETWKILDWKAIEARFLNTSK